MRMAIRLDRFLEHSGQLNRMRNQHMKPVFTLIYLILPWKRWFILVEINPTQVKMVPIDPYFLFFTVKCLPFLVQFQGKTLSHLSPAFKFWFMHCSQCFHGTWSKPTQNMMLSEGYEMGQNPYKSVMLSKAMNWAQLCVAGWRSN